MKPELLNLLLGLYRLHVEATDEELEGMGVTREDVRRAIRKYDSLSRDAVKAQNGFARIVLQAIVGRGGD
jgi:hypothetical protein